METNNKKVIANKAYFYTSEVAQILGMSRGNVNFYLRKHPELKPKDKGPKGPNGVYLWNKEEVDRLIAYRKNHKYKRADKTPAETITAISNIDKPTAVSTDSMSAEALINMFDAFLNIEAEEEKSENRAANRKFKKLFEEMNEQDLKNFFEPLTERFKFAYITKIVGDIQSQTLTCIRNGRLKGLDKYKLNYSAFLKLCKFAAENNCPLNLPNKQEG